MSFLLTIAAKIATKVVLNMVAPGLGTVVDFGEAAHDMYEGNYTGAGMNVAFGVVDLVTLGVASAFKDTVKGPAKEAAKEAAKKSAKEATKKIGEEAAKEIAKGAEKQVIINAAKETAKAATKDVGERLGKELAKGMIGETTEEMFKKHMAREIAEGTLHGLLGSGGKQIGSEVFENVAYNVLSKATEAPAKEAFKSVTSDAARKVAKETAVNFHRQTLIASTVLNGVKGVVA